MRRRFTNFVRAWSEPLEHRIVVVVVLVHGFLLPVVYMVLDRSHWQAASILFETVAHDYVGRLVAELDSGRIAPDEASLRAYVADLRKTSFVRYAEIGWRDQVLRDPELASSVLPQTGSEDVFGSGDDRTFYVSTRWHAGAEQGTLRIGFDESPILDSVRAYRQSRLFILGLYFLAILAAALVLARIIARSLNELRVAADRIADGDLEQRLITDSGIRELDALSHDLERMRAELAANVSHLHQKERLETIGVLAGGVSHEFNNVLVPIILFLESALVALAADHPSRASVGRALAAAERARDIIAKLLIFSGRGTNERLQPIRLASAVEEGVRLFSRLRPSYIEFDSNIDGDADPVRADPGLVVQIVMNLCTNALHAIPPTGGRIGVSLRNIVGGGLNLVEIAVTDSGEGMDSATVARMFEPFFTTRAPGRGSGLGLSVVHGLVTEMHGTITVESAPGSGTCVRIRLPAASN